MHSRVLFICKQNTIYGYQSSYCRRSSGLWNSTRYIVEGLRSRGVHAEIVDVVDNNDIDREVAKYRPDVVVIEALWVVPEKFDVLKRLHPNVKWFIHLHSNIPFLSSEGPALEWISACARKGVGIIANSLNAWKALHQVVRFGRLIYLPNVYIPKFNKPVPAITFRHRLDIGCFGAIRPMKNQLIQAMAAIKFARSKNRPLHFHINGDRIEGGGAPVLKNLRELFRINSHDCKLVEYPWLEPEVYRDILKRLDIGMQVSMTETFNVVTADYVSAGLPVVVSKEIPWVSSLCQAEVADVKDIAEHLDRVYRYRILIWLNQKYLTWNTDEAQKRWYAWALKSAEPIKLDLTPA